jgi:Ras-related protein Rab-6A
MQSNYYDIIIKIIIVGDIYAGKTSLCNKIIYKKFTDDYNTTIGVDFHTCYQMIDNITYKLQLWDITGQERFTSLIPSFFRDIHIALLIIDMNDMNAYDSMVKWYDNIIRFSKAPFHIIVIGNKIDLSINANVNMIKEFINLTSENQSISFIELSVKNSLNLNNLFENIIKKYLILSIKPTTKLIINNNYSKLSCCNII